MDNVLDSVTPALPGVTMQVVSSVVDEIVVDNPTAVVLTVLAAPGEPFLQIGPQGVFANVASPTWVASNSPGGVTSQPAVGPPQWARISSGHSWGWFDPRLPSQDDPPPGGARPGVPITVAQFSIPMRYGTTPVTVRGHLQYQPPTGAVIARLVTPPPAASGLSVAVLPGGPAPGFYAAWTGPAPVTLLGSGGEPFLRFGPFGVQANLSSSTWARVAQAAGHYTPGNGWAAVAPVPRLAWIDPRAAYAPGTPPADVQGRATPTDLVQWTIPVVFGRHTSSVVGVTQWVPDASPSSFSRLAASPPGHRTSVLVPGLIAAVLLVAVVGAVGVVRRQG